MVPIKGLTSTQNPSSIQPFIDKNILKKGYEKAVKEFLDEKRKLIQEEQMQQAPKLVSVRTMTLRSDIRTRNPPLPVEMNRATSNKGRKLRSNESQPNERTSMKPKINNQFPEQMQMTSKRQGKSRLSEVGTQSNPVETRTLRSSSHLRHAQSEAEVTKVKPANQQCVIRKSARIAAKAAKSFLFPQ